MKGQFYLIAFTLTLWWRHGTQAAQNSSHTTFQSFPFRVSYRPLDLVKGQTQNVSLNCAITHNADHPFLLIDFIIISKEHAQGGWVDLAKMDYTSNTVDTFEQGFTAHGQIIPIDEAYLEIEWPLAVDEVFGIFSCVVHGYDTHFQVLEETSEILIQAHDCKAMSPVL